MTNAVNITPAVSHGGGLYSFQVETTGHTQMIDITAAVKSIVAAAGVDEGLCTLYCPHTTGAVTVNENTDPDVKEDILTSLERLVPWENGYRHKGGNSASHIKASLIGATETLIIHSGKLLLGTWQSVYFMEFDGFRARTVYAKITRG